MYQNSPCLFCPSPAPALRFIFPRKPGRICTKESQRLTAHCFFPFSRIIDFSGKEKKQRAVALAPLQTGRIVPLWMGKIKPKAKLHNKPYEIKAASSGMIGFCCFVSHKGYYVK